MASKKRVHIIKRFDGWVLKEEGASRAVRKFATKEEAIQESNKYTLNGQDVVIHNDDGTVESWRSANQQSV